MTDQTKTRASLPSSSRTPHHGGRNASDTAEGAKNFWVQTGRHWNFTMATFTARTLSSEGSSRVLLEERSEIKWDILGLRDVRETG